MLFRLFTQDWWMAMRQIPMSGYQHLHGNVRVVLSGLVQALVEDSCIPSILPYPPFIPRIYAEPGHLQ